MPISVSHTQKKDDDDDADATKKDERGTEKRDSTKKSKKEKKEKEKKKKERREEEEKVDDGGGGGDVRMTDADETARGGGGGESSGGGAQRQGGRVHLLAHEIQSTPDYNEDDVLGTTEDAKRFQKFLDGIRIEVKSMTADTMEFDLIGVDACFANTLRRILLAEVPSVAIETVLVADNTSIIPDEVLAHRLGLVPINADSRKLAYCGLQDSATEQNTVVFKLLVECTRNPLDGSIVNGNVYSKQLKWLPRGSQFPRSDGDPQAQQKMREAQQKMREAQQEQKSHTEGEATSLMYTKFSESQEAIYPNGVRAVDDDILIAKLVPGQRIHLEAHAIKGIGKEHAKWSPVATAWYRMHPEILIADDVVDDLAEKLKATCDMFDVEERNGRKVAVVVDPRTCRACPLINDPEWKDRIHINRVKNHFIFKVESTGALSPADLVRLAFEVLEQKIDRLQDILQQSSVH